MNIPRFSQEVKGMDSGPACLGMIASFHDKNFDIAVFKTRTDLEGDRNTLADIGKIAEKIGFRASKVNLTYEQLLKDAPVPCILQWDMDQFAVFCGKVKRKGIKGTLCAEPMKEPVVYDKNDFLLHWERHRAEDGILTGKVMLLEPTFKFRNKGREKNHILSWRIMMQFFKRCLLPISQVITALLITSLAQLIFPFLMQSIVDVGINTQNLSYITLILSAQIMIVFSRVIVDFIRGRLLLHISTIVNFSVLSDFWIKLTRLPISYFDRNHTGDVLQRINDNKQIQSFLTGPALNTLFSLLNFIVFAIVLMMYKVQLFLIFIAGVVLYFLWIQLFMKVRRKNNYQVFHASARENNITLQLVQGMQEIRLQNIEQPQRWGWERMQAEIFRLNFKNLSFVQLQQSGAIMINQGKDVLLTFIVAKLVVEGQLTFGAMLAIQYILGQLTGPIEQFIGFIQAAQDAKISMERLNQIHEMKDEEDADYNYIQTLPPRKTIVLDNLTFRYPGSENEMPVLNNVQLRIPEGKITAIVGESGSGKTTLLKLLLKIYDGYDGDIEIGGFDLKEIGTSFWRSQCGAVFQDGYIFNDTIARNISLEFDQVDQGKLLEACRMSNILSFIESLPQGFDTRLGVGGTGVSQGQKQRLLIARAIYKNPAYLFFDESTNSLDASNEKAIVENLQVFFETRTVIVVAHRLSTVKNADNIIVLHQGNIIEQGTHEVLSRKKGRYYSLVQNQLELGVES